MAYKFQLGAAILSGSLTQEGQVLAKDSALSGSSLSIAGTAVTATAAELNYLDGADSSINSLSLPDNTTISSYASSSLLNNADEAAFKAAVNLEIGTDVQAQDAGLQYLADLSITDQATFQEQVGLEIGVDVQAYDADLDNLSGMQAGASAALALLTQAEIEILDGATVTTTELNILDGFALESADINNDSIAFYDNSAGGLRVVGFDTYATAIAGDGLVASSGVLAVQVSGAVKLASDKVGISGSIAGEGLAYAGGVDSISGLSVNVDDSTIEISSDSLQLKDNGVTLAKMAGITRGSIIVGDVNGDPSYLAKGTAGQFAVSDGNDLIYRSMSGDATLAADGTLTIAANAVEGSMINANAAGAGLDYASNQLNVAVSGALKVALDKVGLTGSFAGPGLAYEGGVDSISKVALNFNSLAIQETNAANLGATDLFSYYDTADNTQRKVAVPVVRDRIYSDVSGDATIAAGGALTIAAGAVENGMLAGSITANKMNNAIFEDLETLGAPGSDGQFIVATGAGAFAYESGDTARTSLGLGTGDSPTFAGLTINGDLTVTGSLTYVNTTNLAISDALITIGSGSSSFSTDFGLEFGAMGGGWASVKTANEDLSGNGAEGIFKFSHPVSASAVYATSMKATTFYGNLEGSVTETVNPVNSTVSLTIEDGLQVLADASGGAITLTLPSASSLEGKVMKIKKAEDSANVITIDTASGTIDGESSIALESPFAAVSILSDGTNFFIV